MRLSSLCVAAVLLFSVVTFAQHSSGGGGSSSSGSSGGGGGGSHGGSSGGSSGGGGGSHGGSGGSGGGHSSGGSSSGSSAHGSGGSSSHGSSGHGSIATPTSTHPGGNNSRPVSNSQTNHERSVREPSTGARLKTEMPAKRSFFGFLRHPFRRPLPNPQPQPKPVADLRRPVPCLKGPCTFCPPGQAHAGGCGGTFYIRHHRRYCTSGEIWNGGDCLLQTQFLGSCNGLRMSLQRQEQRMRAAESARQSACAAGSSQGCMDSANAAQSEAGLYRTLQERYQRCMQQSLASYPFAGFGFGFGHGYGFGRYSSGLLFEPLDLQFNYP
jgi:hypothetical protein